MSESMADLFAQAMVIENAKEAARRNETYDLGHAAGDAWAAKEATQDELRRLAAYRDAVAEHGFGSLGECIIDVDMPDKYDHAIEILRNLGMMTPADDLFDGARALQFFGFHADNAGYLAGWCEGALELWGDVKDQLA